MLERGVEPVDHRDRQDRVEIFAVPVVGAGRPDPADRSPARGHRRAVRSRRRAARRRLRRAAGKLASSSSVSIAPQMPVRRILALSATLDRHLRIGRGMDIGVADAVEVGEHRHAGVVLHPLDQALAAARHDHVDQPGRAQHRADRLAVLRRHQLDRFGGHPARSQPFGQRGMDRPVRMDRLAAAAQQHRIARPHAQRGGVGGNVGAAFVDDPDQPDRDAHPRQVEPAGHRRMRRSPRRPGRAARQPPRPPRRCPRAVLRRAAAGRACAGVSPRASPAAMSRALAARIAAASRRRTRAAEAQRGGLRGVVHPRQHALRRAPGAGEVGDKQSRNRRKGLVGSTCGAP